MLTLKSLIEAVEKAKVINFCEDGWEHNLIDADILLSELKKMDEYERKKKDSQNTWHESH